MAKTPREVARTVKTTVELPETLWRAAKIRAMDERCDLRTVLINALHVYLNPRAPKPDAHSGGTPKRRK